MRLRRKTRGLATASAAAGLWAALGVGLASAAPPIFTYSVYVTSSSTTAAYNQGCALGGKVGAGSRPSDAFTILDFGYPDYQSGYGTLLMTSTYPFVTIGQIEGMVEQYGKGYYDCSPTRTSLRIGVGENTSNVSVNGVTHNYFTAADGTAWGNMVTTINTRLGNNGYSTQVSTGGAADIENASGWATFPNVKAWSDAFSATTAYAMYDFGSANGCSYANTYGNNPCNSSWNTCDEWYASWHGVAYPAPEDYNQAYSCSYTGGCSYTVDNNARQWEAISRYGYHYQGGSILIKAAVTQYEACVQRDSCSGVDNSPGQGYGDMYNALNHDYAPLETSQSVEWSTDFEWGYTLW